jgi:hypothetical protein
MNFLGLKSKAVAITVSVLVAGSAFGYLGYGEYKEQGLRHEVMEIVKDTSLQMRDALSVESVPTSASQANFLRQFYDHAEAVDAHFQKLHSLDVLPIGELAGVVDDYVLTSREILIRRASSQRYRLKLSGSIQALRNHMRTDDHTGAWVSEAIRAKERVEEDYRDYRVAINALGSLLGSYPAAWAKLAPHVEAALLVDESLIEDAHRRALEAAAQAADQIEKARQLASYR